MTVTLTIPEARITLQRPFTYYFTFDINSMDVCGQPLAASLSQLCRMNDLGDGTEIGWLGSVLLGSGLIVTRHLINDRWLAETVDLFTLMAWLEGREES